LKSGQRPGALKVIGVFRLAKALILAAAAVGILEFVKPQFRDRITAWFASLPFLARHGEAHAALSRVSHASHGRIALAGIVVAAYAALFAAEGIGLLLGKVWAEYLTLIATASFIPFEIYEIAKRASVVSVVFLVVNVAIVGYLAYRLRRRKTTSS
jgi:uncharacterized membrane protein (DUF2068 family)